MLVLATVKSQAQTATPTPTPILTTAQVTQLATTFCSNLNVAVGTSYAVYPAPAPTGQSQSSYWLACWQVSFKSSTGLQAVVEVADATGEITSFHNYTMSAQALTSNVPLTSPISATIAIQNATSALQASGMPSDLALTPRATSLQITSPPTSAGNLWIVSWQRQWNGVPYAQQQVTVMLQGQTGLVQSFRKTFPAAPLLSSVVSVTSTQATATAQTQLTQAGIVTAALQACVQFVVQPNTKWQVGGSQIPSPNAAGTLVWDCVYSDTTDPGAVYEVWIDTATGVVNGGQTFTVAGSRSVARNRKAVPFNLKHRS